MQKTSKLLKLKLKLVNNLNMFYFRDNYVYFPSPVGKQLIH